MRSSSWSAKGFVTILPRRGVLMNRLRLQDVKDAYDIVGALEAAVVMDVCNRLDAGCLDSMTAVNAAMKALLARDDFDNHYAAFFGLNVDFHNRFLDLSENRQIKKIVLPFKQRLYDFPRRRFIRELGTTQLPGARRTRRIDPGRRREGGRRPAAEPTLVFFLLRGFYPTVL